MKVKESGNVTLNIQAIDHILVLAATMIGEMETATDFIYLGSNPTGDDCMVKKT